MSGCMPTVSLPNQLPVRPKPVTISSSEAQHVVFAQHLLDAGEVAGGRHDDAAAGVDRLCDEGGDRVRAFAKDEDARARRPDAPRKPLRPRPPACRDRDPGTGVCRMPGRRQAELAMHEVEPAQRGGDDGRAMEGAIASDDLALPGFAAHGVIDPGQLDHGLVRLRARGREIGFATGHAGECNQLLGQRRGCLSGAVKEGVIEAELGILPRCRRREPLVGETERSAPQTRHRVDIFLAAGIIDARALPAPDNDRACFGELGRVGLRMQMEIDVAAGGRVGKGV